VASYNTRRSRSKITRFGKGVSTFRERNRVRTTGAWVTTLNTRVNNPRYDGQRTIVDEVHDWPPPSGGGFRDVGGPMTITKQIGVIPLSSWSHSYRTPLPTGFYDLREVTQRKDLGCPIELGANGKPLWPTAQGSSDSTLNALGATAISRCRPTSSTSELSVAMGELYKDGLPHLVGSQSWRERTLTARNAGSEYLNAEFGWLPLVNDVTSFGNSVVKSDDILKQYEADEGKVIRREYSFPQEQTVSSPVLLSNSQAPYGVGTTTSGGPGPSTNGQWYKQTTTVKNRWFSGAFVYGVPKVIRDSSDLPDLAAKADKLFGISLTPDVLWNLTPWSWAIDWFTNVGDVLSTVGDMMSQGLVMKYGYLMEETSVRVTYSLTGVQFNGKPAPVPNSYLEVITKKRVKASPFGFGISWDGLSPFQVSILAALGFSRT
jgi:hypothetical protein